MRLLLCVLLVAVVNASPHGSRPNHQEQGEAQLDKKLFETLKKVLVNALNDVAEMPNPDDLPDNYHNSTIQKEIVNGTAEITNTTVVKTTKDGIEETEVTKTEERNGKIKTLSQMLALRKKNQGRSTEEPTTTSSVEGSGEGSGDEEDMVANSQALTERDLEDSLERLRHKMNLEKRRIAKEEDMIQDH